MDPLAEAGEIDDGGRALTRILRDLAEGQVAGNERRAATGDELLDMLAEGLPGADLTTVLLEAFRRRASRMTPADVMRRYRTDRFVAPASSSVAALRRAEDAMLAALPDGFDVLMLAPVLPLGAHSATGGVDPRNVIATIRSSEVAADPTNGLALEAAARRRRLLAAAPRTAQPVRLAATQRVTRAQQVTGQASFAHFQLLGLVSAGRDTGDRAFERQHLVEHLRFAAGGLAALGLGAVTIAITCLDEPSRQVLAFAVADLAGLAGVEVKEAADRESGRAYYRGLCFKIFAGPGATGTAEGRGAGRDLSAPQDGRGADHGVLEVADGGFVDWTAKLIGSRKERLLISGYGIDRLAILGAR